MKRARSAPDENAGADRDAPGKDARAAANPDQPSLALDRVFSSRRHADIELVVRGRSSSFFLDSEILRTGTFFDALLSDRWRGASAPALVIGAPVAVPLADPLHGEGDEEHFTALLRLQYFGRFAEEFTSVPRTLDLARLFAAYGWQEGVNAAVAHLRQLTLSPAEFGAVTAAAEAGAAPALVEFAAGIKIPMQLGPLATGAALKQLVCDAIRNAALLPHVCSILRARLSASQMDSCDPDECRKMREDVYASLPDSSSSWKDAAVCLDLVDEFGSLDQLCKLLKSWLNIQAIHNRDGISVVSKGMNKLMAKWKGRAEAAEGVQILRVVASYLTQADELDRGSATRGKGLAAGTPRSEELGTAVDSYLTSRLRRICAGVPLAGLDAAAAEARALVELVAKHLAGHNPRLLQFYAAVAALEAGKSTILLSA